MVGSPAHAAAVSADTVKAMQDQINSLQQQLQQVQAAQATQAAPAAPAATSSSGIVDKAASFMDSDAPLTWNGVTLYGTVDVGVSNQTHGSGYNANFNTAVGEMLQKNGAGSKWNVTPGGMEQSKIGLKGDVPVYKDSPVGDVNAVFKLEAGFNPVSGVLTNAQESQINNNGNASLARTSTNADSSRAGQVFEGAAFGGLSNKTLGTLTFGRHTTVLADDITTYDPQGASYAFSPIEWSGAIQGGGDTEEARYDDSMKYNVAYGPVRFAGIYQFAGNTNPYGGDDAYQGDVGFDYAGLSLDALLGEKHDAINTSTNTTASILAGNMNELKATSSDNTTYAFLTKYDFKDVGIKVLQPAKIFLGYEHDHLSNADTPVSLNASSLGGYQYYSISNGAYNVNEDLDVVWGGVRYAFTPKLTVSAADYQYIQSRYGTTGSSTPCGDSSCAGTANYSSLVADYQLTKKIDAYAGVMYSHVYNGMDAGYLHNNNVSTATGLRLKF